MNSTWTKHAEWHPAPQTQSDPSLIAMLSQAHIRSYWPDHGGTRVYGPVEQVTPYKPG